jgi:hypothetical protein
MSYIVIMMIQMDEINWESRLVTQAQFEMFKSLMAIEREVPDNMPQWCQAMNKIFDVKVIAKIIGRRVESVNDQLSTPIEIDTRITDIVNIFNTALSELSRDRDPRLMDIGDLSHEQQRKIILWIDSNMALECNATFGTRFGKKGLMFDTKSLILSKETFIRCNQCNKVIFDSSQPLVFTDDPYLLIWLHIQRIHLADILTPTPLPNAVVPSLENNNSE